MRFAKIATSVAALLESTAFHEWAVTAPLAASQVRRELERVRLTCLQPAESRFEVDVRAGLLAAMDRVASPMLTRPGPGEPLRRALSRMLSEFTRRVDDGLATS